MALSESIHRRLPSATVAGGEITISSISDGFPAGGPVNFFSLERAMEEIMPPALEALLRNLLANGRIAAVIVDMIASWGIDVARRFSLPTAGFWPASFVLPGLVSSSPEMVRRGLISASGVPLAGRDDAVVFSGACGLELTASDLPWLVGDLPSQKGRFTFWQRAMERWAKLRWIVANSPFSVADESSPATRVFRVAPLQAVGKYRCSLWEEDMSCLSWLDSQEPGSVVYVSFGSWVPPMGGEFIAELAAGLRSSGRPFLWVAPLVPPLSPPPSSSRGMVLRWVAQKEVLEHAAVGSFLTHCGWNSMEAVRFKKPKLCYPLAGDQFANCKQIVRTWKVGVKLHEMRCGAGVQGLAALTGPGGAAMRRRLDALSEQVFGGGGAATAAAELLAFVNELRDGRTI